MGAKAQLQSLNLDQLSINLDSNKIEFVNKAKYLGLLVKDDLKPLSHSTAIPRRWHGDLKFLRAPWDRTKILKNIANNFTLSITWRCHGAPTATVAFPRSAYGVPPRPQGVLTGDWLRSHGALTACSWRAKSCQCASTTCTQRARRAQCVSTACPRSVYEHMRKQVPQAYSRNRHAYKRELSGVRYLLIFVDVDIGILLCFIYLFYVIIFNAGEDRHIAAMVLAILEIIQ